MNYIDEPVKSNLFEKGFNVFGENAALFSGNGLNAKTQTMYEAGVPSNFIQDGDTIVRLNIVDGYLQSDGFISGSVGWQIKSDGSVEFNNGVFRGSLLVGTNALHVDISGNIWWGNYATYAAAVAANANLISASGVANLNGLIVGTNVGLGTAQTAGQVTTIIGNTVTTGYVNALSITAASVAAENISGTYITGKIVRTSSGGSRVELNGGDNRLYCFDGSGNIQGSIYGSADDLNIVATDNVNIMAGGRTALNLGYEFCVPVDDGHYTIGTNTGKGLQRVWSYAFSNPSDRRLKKDIKTIESALDKVMKLRGVSFKWKKKDTNDDKKQIGLIAQEVKRVVPEVVTGKGGKEKYGIDYGDLAGLFVEAIKELNNKIK